MRLAFLSDIHANFEALTAVLRDVERHAVDQLVCLGDVVGYGCDPGPCLDLVDRACAIKLLGNHDAAALGATDTESYNTDARTATEWTQGILTGNDLVTLTSFTTRQRIDNALAVHASPYEPDQWHYILGPVEAETAFQHFEEQICFHGHTHLPAIFTETPDGLPRQRAGHSFDPNTDSRYLINVGSVGQPRDDDPRACWVLYDTDLAQVDFLRVEYDIARTQSKMTAAHLPNNLVARLAVGR